MAINPSDPRRDLTADPDDAAAAARYQAELRRLGSREALTDGERSELDQQLYEAFLRFEASDDPADIAELRALVEQGARTDAFVNYELGGRNIAQVIEDWISRPGVERRTGERITRWPHPVRARDGDERLLEALRVISEAGPALIRNRYYVGNGGLPAFHAILEFFARGEEYALTDRRVLLEEILQLSLELGQRDARFLRDFQSSVLYALRTVAWRHRDSGPLSPLRRELLTSSLIAVVDLPHYPTAAELGAAYNSDESYGASCLEYERQGVVGAAGVRGAMQDLISLQDRELLTTLLTALLEGRGRLANALRSSAEGGASLEEIETVLRAFSGSRETRSLLISFLNQYRELRSILLRRPALVFSLVERREVRTLKVLLRRERAHMRDLRDHEGRTLLDVARATRGRTEKLVALLETAGVPAGAARAG